MKCTRCKRLLLEKAFYLSVVFVFRHLKITSDSEQPMLKEKLIIPPVFACVADALNLLYIASAN